LTLRNDTNSTRTKLLLEVFFDDLSKIWKNKTTPAWTPNPIIQDNKTKICSISSAY